MLQIRQSGHDGTLVVSNPVKSDLFSSTNWVKISIGILVILNTIDGGLTLFWVLSNHVEEANPLMANLIEIHPVLFMLVKISLVHLSSLLLWRLRSRSMVAKSTFFLVLVYGFVMCCHIAVV